MLPDFERADRIGEYWENPKTRAFADLLIDCEDGLEAAGVLVGMLRERTELPRTTGARRGPAPHGEPIV